MNECNCSWIDKILGEGCRVCNPQEMINLLLEHIAELEQRIAEIEAPKTCELDCAYYDNEYGCNCPFPCTRIKDDDAKDYYEPKEQK